MSQSIYLFRKRRQPRFLKTKICSKFLTTEFEFTVVCLQILVWIYVNAIHSRVFILDLPANIDLGNLYDSILAGKSVCL
jgi:hypothetical protein